MLWGFMSLFRIMNPGVCAMSLFADYVKFCTKVEGDLDLWYSRSFIYSFSWLQIQNEVHRQQQFPKMKFLKVKHILISTT